MSDYFEIRDPVYGFIKIDEWEKTIIGHPAFQRLRRIKQLAFTDMVYPGAVYTRFEHSLGVMHLATEMFDAIVRNEENVKLLRDKFKIEKAGLIKDRKLIRLAALLHDIGHAPFSHGGEEVMPEKPSTKKKFTHEDYTVAIIRGPLKEIIESNPINISNYDITADMVAALVEKDPLKLGHRLFWSELIASQVDADRCDYLFRDSLHCGVKYGSFDVNQFLATITLGKVPETKDNVVIGIRKGGRQVAESIIFARYQMFTQVYYHKTRRAYDIILTEILKKMLGQFPPPSEIDKYLTIDDLDIWSYIKQEKDINEWCNMVFYRNHIRKIKDIDHDSKDAQKEISEIEDNFKQNKIWYIIDSPDRDKSNEAKQYYKINKNVMIINDNHFAEPLQKKSPFIENIKGQNISRLYVKPEDREKAQKLIREGK
jgi:uncharacterized protein